MMKKIRNKMSLRLLSAVSMALFLFTTSCTTVVPMTGRQQFNTVPIAELNAYSANLFHEIARSDQRSYNRNDIRRVERVATRLVSALESYFRETGETGLLAQYDWEYIVVKDNTPNAACFPGGKIMVHAGMLSLAESDEYLAVVMAHEMAHAIANHTAERQTDAQLAEAVLSTVAGGENSDGAINTSVQLAMLGLMLPHSRFQEAESDHIGLIIMSMAGYNPRVAPKFWEKMSKATGGGIPEFMSTHPANSSRIRQLEALVPTVMPIYRKAKLLGR